MAQASDKKRVKASEEFALLEELKQVATRLNFAVRQERLLREFGYRVRSGTCRVRDSRLILLDKDLPPSVQIDVLVDALAGTPLDDVYVSPAARRLLERAAA